MHYDQLLFMVLSNMLAGALERKAVIHNYFFCTHALLFTLAGFLLWPMQLLGAFVPSNQQALFCFCSD